jgi:hypothetical protein
VSTFPFKINLEEDIHYGVFTRVIEKIKNLKIADPPSAADFFNNVVYQSVLPADGW